MENQKKADEISRQITRPVTWMQGICLLTFISSPFVWIWLNWALAWRVGLSGFIGAYICYFISKVTRKVASDYLESIKKSEPPK
jgi:hypothetical protein